MKEHYIRVESPGGGGGGSGKDQSKSGGAGDPTAPLWGKPNPRPKVKPLPYIVKAPGGGVKVEKDRRVYTGDGSGAGGEEPYGRAYGRYRKAAEEALSREAIPPALRDYVRRYFEGIGPK